MALDSVFKIPGKPNEGFGPVKIMLTPCDHTPRMEFLAVRESFAGGDYRIEAVAEHDDIYFDSLQEIFRQETGLATSLNMRRVEL